MISPTVVNLKPGIAAHGYDLLGDGPYSLLRSQHPYGSFLGIAENNVIEVGYYTCRESFATVFAKYPRIGFVKSRFVDPRDGFKFDPAHNINIELVNKFFRISEEKLNVKDPTIFYPTNIPHIIVIKPSSIWYSNTTAESLFTLLLRAAGVYYTQNHTIKAIQAYPLGATTVEAIKWFLAGNTKPTYRSVGNGFYSIFSGITDPVALGRLLVKP